MANFMLPNGTADSQVNTEVHVDPDVVRAGTVAVQRGPIGDVAAGTAAVVVTNYGDDTVSVLNADTLAVEDIIAVGGEPFAVVVSDDRAYISTSSVSFDAVSVIDTNTGAVIANYPLAFGVTALAISPDGKRVYAGRTGSDHVDVAVIDTTAERIGTIDIAAGAAGIGIDALRVDPSGKRLYVATTDDRGSRLVLVDTETARVQRTVWVGSPIRDLAITGDTALVLTSDRAHGGVVSTIDLSAGEITDTVKLGGAPTQMTLSADGSRAYVVDYDHIAVVCALTLDVVSTVTVDARPSCVTLSCDGGRLYVADYAGNVTAFSVASTTPLLYSHFVTTDPIAVSELRQLEGVRA